MLSLIHYDAFLTPLYSLRLSKERPKAWRLFNSDSIFNLTPLTEDIEGDARVLPTIPLFNHFSIQGRLSRERLGIIASSPRTTFFKPFSSPGLLFQHLFYFSPRLSKQRPAMLSLFPKSSFSSPLFSTRLSQERPAMLSLFLKCSFSSPLFSTRLSK